MSAADHSVTAADHVIALDDPNAADVELVGGKAAALAEATRDLPVLPGFVVTTSATGDADRLSDEVLEHVRVAWAELTAEGKHPVVARSSSPAEDTAETSMAGRFESSLDLTTWDAVVEGLQTVLSSRRRLEQADDTPDHLGIAVLVQRALVEPRLGGVLFTRDPVEGRHVVVSAVPGSPEPLVSGEVDGSTYRLGVTGEIVAQQDADDGGTLDPELAGRLAELADAIEQHYGSPQDVEWAVDRDGALWLLQSRPITTPVPSGPVEGPVFGPGPVTETFPEPLSPLEQDLWLPPLREAIRVAVSMVGARSDDDLADAPTVITVHGRVAVNLELFDEAPGSPSWRERLDPRPRVRRLVAAWRVGRLRSMLPRLGRHVVMRTDEELAAVPPLVDLTDRQLVGMLGRSRDALRALHGHEIAMGMLVDVSTPHVTGNSLALRLLSSTRREGLSDHEIIRRYPTVLALSPPQVREAPHLPPEVPDVAPVPPESEELPILREALRLRVRWVQELQARAAWHLGQRLAERDLLVRPGDVRGLSLDALAALVRGAAVTRTSRPDLDLDSSPLPAAFRLAENGVPVPVRDSSGDGQGAGGGRRSGPVHLGLEEEPDEGDVLVVSSLAPEIAPWLSRLGGLVAETGSVLSHVAILAREAGIPTVVSSTDATQRFSEGDMVTVDGANGTVEPTSDDEERPS